MNQFKIPFMVLAIVLTGCATISGTVDPPKLQESGCFQAGAARIDITPPPGYPMGGHSIAGQISRGVWVRLSARSIFLEDKAGKRVVLVSADLWSIPAGLSDRVAELNSRGPAECTLGRGGLILAATHTHQSPGNFSSSPMYNSFASPVPGFDPDLFEFLAHRIAFSVEKACMDRRPAQVFYKKARMTRKAFARNRSFEAFRMNPEAEAILKENADLPLGEQVPEYAFPESYRAIDPVLQVLRIREGTPPRRDIAVAAFVAVHTTALTHDAEVYNSDIFGVAAISAERKLSSDNDAKSPVVVAIFNGAGGDISPAWIRQDRRDTLSLGEDLADNIVSLGYGSIVDEVLDYQFSVEPLAGRCFAESNNKTLCTDSEPMAGAPTLGGAEDGRTPFYYLGWKEGIKGHSNDRQDPKQPAFDLPLPVPDDFSLTRIIGEIYTAPKEIPVGVYTLGPLTVATLPGEFTTVLGRRIAREVKDILEERSKEVILIGLANEYLSYFTTPEEYNEQSYEGASMLFGKAAGVYVGDTLGQLASKLLDNEPYRHEAMEYKYKAGLIRRFGMEDVQPTDFFFFEKGLSSILEDVVTGKSILPDTPTFCWRDRVVNLRSGVDIRSEVVPRVSIITPTADMPGWKPLLEKGYPEDDGGLHFLTVVLPPQEDSVIWCTFWMPPKSLKGPTKSFRFSVRTLTGEQILSPDCIIEKGRVNRECLFDPRLIPLTREQFLRNNANY